MIRTDLYRNLKINFTAPESSVFRTLKQSTDSFNYNKQVLLYFLSNCFYFLNKIDNLLDENQLKSKVLKM